jgi:uncharacterized protein YbjT (DUF2867 family)
VKVIVFGATGMVGQGVLRECLLDSDVERVLVVGRIPTGERHEKLREIVQPDVSDLSSVENELSEYDACFFCLGVSSIGMSEDAYRRVTYDLTMSVARTMASQNAEMTFIYVSGAGTDSSGHGRTMWARVKGQTENELLALPFKAYMFRPAFIQPMHGVKSKTRLYRLIYVATAPLFPVLRRAFPRIVTSSETLGRAMLKVASAGAPKRILESRDINAVP